MNLTRAALLAVLLAGPALAQDGLAPPRATKERGLVFVAPATWRAAEPVEPERAAWVVRPAAGAPRLRASLLRHKQKRPLDELVARWARAFVDAEGKPIAPAAAQREPVALEGEGVEGVTATLVLLRGTHVGATEPGEEAPPRHEGWAALHALVEGPDGAWVVSVTGPAAAVDAARDGVVALVKSARLGLVEPDAAPDDAPPAPDAPDAKDPEGD